MDNELNIQCESCSATLKFKPGTDCLSCSYCGKTHQIIPSETKYNGIQSFDIDDYVREIFDTESQVALTLVKCNVCSAEITLGEKLISKDCLFCSTPLVFQQSKVNRTHKPHYMLPFAISENESEEVFQDWIKKRWFAPNALKKYGIQNKKLQGVYLPFWLYDCTATSYYEGKQGTVYLDSMGSSQKTKIKWDSVRGTVYDIFDDVLVPATHSLPNRKLDALEPWDLEYLKPFDGRYLTGFKTENYQISLRDGFSDAKQKMSRIIRRHIKRDIGAEQQQISHVSTLMKILLLSIFYYLAGYQPIDIEEKPINLL